MPEQNVSNRFLASIEKACVRKGITRADLADKVGVSRSFITQLLSGKKVPSMAFIDKVEKAIKVTFKITTHA